MPPIHTHSFSTQVFNGDVSFNTGLFINGKFVDGSHKGTIDVFNPATEELICKIAEATSKDVDIAVQAARKAFQTTWGLNATGAQRARYMYKLADLMEQHADEIAALEALDNGKAWTRARYGEVVHATECIRYFAGAADKIQGDVIETSEDELVYTRREPIGVVGQIVPWNFPLVNVVWKIGPALATGNTIVLKPSEFTPLSVQFLAALVVEAGFPPGVLNVVSGLGSTVGQAISEHPDIDKVAFTGSTLTGRKILDAVGRTNIKDIALELGGKSPVIIFDDAELGSAVEWAVHGIFYNSGQVCAAGSRIFVQASIYDNFLEAFTAKVKSIKIGDPFAADTYMGPVVSDVQLKRVLDYIDIGKNEGATLHLGGERVGTKGDFVHPTIFTNCTPDMTIVREEIFGPVAVVIKFTDDEDVVRQANDTIYGLAAGIFSQNIKRALKVAHKIQAGTVGVNMVGMSHWQAPFGGFKQSGIGRELGLSSLQYYTAHKSVLVNLGVSAPPL